MIFVFGLRTNPVVIIIKCAYSKCKDFFEQIIKKVEFYHVLSRFPIFTILKRMKKATAMLRIDRKHRRKFDFEFSGGVSD